MTTGYKLHHARCPLETGPWDIPGVECQCPPGWPRRKRLLTIRTVNGTYQPVTTGHQVGPFFIHRSVRKRGWTITHLGTADAVVIGLPNLQVAVEAAHEFMRLFSKWHMCKRRYDLLGEVRKVANGREWYALALFIYHLRQRHPRTK